MIESTGATSAERDELERGELLGELDRARSQIAALEQLIEVHEQTSLEQATRLEQSLAEREAVLDRERAARGALVESEGRLRLALEAGRMGTWEWDIAAGRVHWSPEEERLYGLEPGTFDGTVEAYRARIHPDDVAESWRRVQDALERGAESHHVLHRIVRPDGEVRWLESHGRFLFDADRRPLRLVGVSADVTERRAMEDALRYQHYITETITNNATAALFMMDADGRATYMNAAAEAMTGFTLAEIREYPLHYAIHHHRPDGSLYPMAECPVDRALPENFDVRAHEDVFIRKDGTYFPVLCAASPIFEDGRPVGTVVEVRDVTEERRRERALEESTAALRQREEEFRTMANSIPQLAWMAAADGSIEWYNQRWYDYTGTAPGAMQGWGWEGIHHPEHLERVTTKFVAAVRAGEAWEDTFPIRGADGTYRWFLSRALPIRDAEGNVVRWFGTNTDVTERLEIEAARDRALAEAKAEREQLYEVFMQAPAAIAVLEGPEHVFAVSNPRYQELIGGRPVLGKGIREALPELAGQGFYEILDRVRSSGEAFVGGEVPVRLSRGGGAPEAVYVDFVYQPLKEADGSVRGIMAHAVDVTPQVRARQRIEALAAEREAILGQIADVVVTTDLEGRITFFNAAAAAIYGDMRAGLPIWDAAQPFTLLDLEGRVRDVAEIPLRRAVAGERVIDEEWRVRRADGTEVVVLGSAVPVYAAQDGAQAGALLGAVMTVRDVTAQRRLQRQLEYERMRLQDVLTQAPAAITVTEGPDHVFVMQNDVARQLVGGRNIVGRRLRDVFPEIEHQGFLELQDQVVRTGEPFVGREMRAVLDRDGDGVAEEGFFNFVYHPLRDAEGRVYGILTHAVEVTDQVLARRQVEEKAAELVRITQELERSNRELDQFAYVASHDLKAPLRGIANLTQWIEEDLGDRVTGESAEHMQLLKGRVNRMEALIDGILAYSRAGRVREKAELVDVGRLVREVVELLAPPPETEIVVGPDLPTVETERVPLQQVFMNLIGNAIKYNRRPGARVEITVARDGALYDFAVADNGPGIAPQYHDRIWGIFQTLAARDKVEGTGIGLSVVKKIVEARGGRVWLDSDVGRGATFHFTWPRTADQTS